MSNKIRVLFLCVHNSARSQLAEGLLRAMAGDRIEVFSAGSEPSFVHPLALQVLYERGIDASQHRSKSVQEFASAKFDYVITLCAEEVCPIFLGATQKLHWALADPAAAHPEKQLTAFRLAANELENCLQYFIEKEIHAHSRNQ